MIDVPSQAIQSSGAVKKHKTAQKVIVPLAAHFARRLTARYSRQLRSIGPNTRCDSNHACSRNELRIAAQAAINTKTVVGMPGTQIPMNASARHRPANASKSQRRIPVYI